MDSISLLSPSLDFNSKEKDHNGGVIFDSSLLQKQTKIPTQFIWPQPERPSTTPEELQTPVVNIGGFLKGDQGSTREAIDNIRGAFSHGFFQVINHGVDGRLCWDASDGLDRFFKLPLDRKLRARRRPGSTWGYAGAHTDRFSSRLPWKETLSFGYGEGRRLLRVGAGQGVGANGKSLAFFLCPRGDKIVKPPPDMGAG